MKTHYLPIFCLATAGLYLSSCADTPGITTEDLFVQLEEAMIASSDGVGVDYYKLPDSDDFASIPQDPNNPMSAEKVELGKLLFHETGLAVHPENVIGARTYSCASCHHAAAGFQANMVQGIGEGGIGFGLAGEARKNHPIYMPSALDVQPIRTPSAMNLAWQECILWNGQFGATGINEETDYAWTPGTPKEVNQLGFTGLETQAIAGLDVHRMDMTLDIAEELGYKEMFDEVFASIPAADRYTKVTAGMAIGAYERTLISNEAPFQKWLNGDMNAMNEVELRGAITFFTKGECVSCHNGPTLATMEFHALGMQDLNGPSVFNTNPTDGENRGREGFTSRPEDLYRFKVPQLYNLTDSRFYGHGGSFRNLMDVLEYKNNGIKANNNVPDNLLSEHFKPLNLTSTELRELYAFLANSLHDDDLARFVPDALPSGLCFPNNDAVSRDDLGCN